ncbi:hypothetical protein CE91St14_08410 [Porphyromonas somerae]|nr:hypothetical protein CE91St14_08410 [Porphyromonas somerae]
MLKNRTTLEMTQFIVRICRRGEVVAYDDEYLVDGSIDLKAMIDAGEFGDNFRYYRIGDEKFLPDTLGYTDKFKALADDEFITSDGIVYREGEPITSFGEDMTTYEVIEINSAKSLVDELNSHYVKEKVGDNIVMWLGYKGDILFGRHKGSAYMEWYLYDEEVGDD